MFGTVDRLDAAPREDGSLLAIQTTLEEGIPLADVTFCVVDLETTGGSPQDSRITEVGAVKYRGGEKLGSFRTFVNPEQPIPRFITHLTGITDADVEEAPPIEWIMPELLEFLRGGVFVAHNAGFDFGFVNAALMRLDYDPLPPPPVCTARLARRVVWPDVPNVKLHTLAEYFRCVSQPSHRALDDAMACAEVLHGLLDRAGRMGILTLGDLQQAVKARGRPNFAKIRVTDTLPTGPGVYVFRNAASDVLYVGKSKNIRQRVKSYFYGDGRKKIEDLLAEMKTVEGIACSSELEALVLEARMIREHEPKYNRQGKTWRRYAYLKLDTSEAWPRIKVVRETKGDGAFFLGPFPSASQANLAKEAIEDAFEIRRCTRSMGTSTRFSPCALADMGRCQAPCDDRTTPERYAELIRGLISSLHSPGGLLEALEQRMDRLAAMDRFEEAAQARDRLRALGEALRRRRTDEWIAAAGALTLRDADGRLLQLEGGTLVRSDGPQPISAPCPRERADELSAVRAWLTRNPVTIEDSAEPVAEAVDSGARLNGLLDRLRAAEKPLYADRR